MKPPGFDTQMTALRTQYGVTTAYTKQQAIQYIAAKTRGRALRALRYARMADAQLITRTGARTHRNTIPQSATYADADSFPSPGTVTKL